MYSNNLTHNKGLIHTAKELFNFYNGRGAAEQLIEEGRNEKLLSGRSFSTLFGLDLFVGFVSLA